MVLLSQILVNLSAIYLEGIEEFKHPVCFLTLRILPATKIAVIKCNQYF